jgi:hypothetical protein
MADQEASYRSYLDKVEQGTFAGLFADLARQRLKDLSKIAKSPDIQPSKSKPADAPKPAEKVAMLGGPRKVLTSGKDGTVYVEGSFTNQGNGEWVEENTEHPDNPLYFRAIDVSKNRVLLYDPDRDMYLELNLKAKSTRWKRGDVRNWNSLYKITKIQQ